MTRSVCLFLSRFSKFMAKCDQLFLDSEAVFCQYLVVLQVIHDDAHENVFLDFATQTC